MITLAVDPGIRGCGVALFRFSQSANATLLERAAYVRNPLKEGNGPAESAAMAQAVVDWFDTQPRERPFPDVLALEYPRVYQGNKQKGDPNDLLPLAGVVCAVSGLLLRSEVRRYFPHEWKGTVDADVMLARIVGRLRPDEVGKIEPCPASLRHNVVDAIGIGLKAVGRFEPHRVIAR